MVTTFKWWLGSVILPLAAIAGAIILFASKSDWGWTKYWFGLPETNGSTGVGLVLSIAGLVIGPIIPAINQLKIHSRLIADFKTTLVPTAAQLIASAASPNNDRVEDRIYTIMKDLRAFIGTTGTNADSNLYVLSPAGTEGGLGTKLERVHRSDTEARFEFTKTKSNKPKALEESAVVDRVLAKTRVNCRNVKKSRLQKKFTLDPETTRSYKAFMSVPVVLDGKAIGMLSVNSNESGVIRTYHYDYLGMIANMIADLHRVQPLRPYEVHGVHNGTNKG